MAIQHLPAVHFLQPSTEQAALQTTCEYLNQAGTRVASVELSFPPLGRDTAMLAKFSTQMLRSAALCFDPVRLRNRAARARNLVAA